MTQPSAPAPGDAGSRRVLFSVHTGRRDIVDLARTSAARLAAGGITVRVLEEEAEALAIEGAEVVPPGPAAAHGAEIVLVFGGDGTFLRAAELAHHSHAALMGINLGRVGFLAETEPEAVEETLTAIERCEYSVEKRLAVEVDVFDADGAVIGSTWGLNEVSVEKAERSRVLDVVIAIDGRLRRRRPCRHRPPPRRRVPSRRRRPGRCRASARCGC